LNPIGGDEGKGIAKETNTSFRGGETSNSRKANGASTSMKGIAWSGKHFLTSHESRKFFEIIHPSTKESPLNAVAPATSEIEEGQMSSRRTVPGDGFAPLAMDNGIINTTTTITTVSVSRRLLQHFPNYFIVADEDGHPPLEKQEEPDQDLKAPNQNQSHQQVAGNSIRIIHNRLENVAVMQTDQNPKYHEEPSSINPNSADLEDSRMPVICRNTDEHIPISNSNDYYNIRESEGVTLI
jgi:hypothetical protein